MHANNLLEQAKILSKNKALAMVVAAALLPGSVAIAADHRDAPALLGDPAADINDVLAWMSADAQTLNMVMTVFPNANSGSRFSDAVGYRFHTVSQASFGATAGPQVDVECTFNAAQVITCNVGNVTVTGDASATTGIASGNGQLRVFAGLRNDPFFFNGSGFRATAEAVTAAAGSLTFDADGCPTLDAATSNALVTQLQREPDGSAAQDNFAGQNVLAIVLSVDKSLLNTAGDIVSVYGSTVRSRN